MTATQFHKILFIGAGASRGARVDHSVQPPLGKELLQFLAKTIPNLKGKAGAARLSSELAEAERIISESSQYSDFELLIASLPRDRRESLHRVIQICFSDLYDAPESIEADYGFRSQPDGYDTLIERLKIGVDPWKIISLNYDVLFEEALSRAKINFQYVNVPVNWRGAHIPGYLEIYKPHGSINFIAHSHQNIGHGRLAEVSTLTTSFGRNSKGEVTLEEPIVFAGQPGAKNVIYEAVNSLKRPIMANFTNLKETDVNESVLRVVRSQAIEAAAKAESVLIVGVAPIVDEVHDPFCASFFKCRFQEVTYVTLASGEGASDVQTIRRLYPSASVFMKGLGDYLARNC
jgi:hypothetical protein